MSKRSNFTRRANDAYLTWDPRAVAALAPHLAPGTRFAEPCAGEGHLVAQLIDLGHTCTEMDDLEYGRDALDWMPEDLVITNPPWSRPILHALIEHWPNSWLLFDADWAHTKQAIPYLTRCTDIVSVRRLRWIEGSKMDGKDNCAWYRFGPDSSGITRFHHRIV